jgi:hypothetical protein
MQKPTVAALAIVVLMALLGQSSCDPNAKHDGTVLVDAPAGKCWSGAIGDSTKEGCGPASYDLHENIIVANAQKTTDGRWTLGLSLLIDGETVDTSSTNAQYGIAEVSE